MSAFPQLRKVIVEMNFPNYYYEYCINNNIDSFECFPHRSMDAIKSKHYELCIAKNKKITKVATRFSSRIAKSKNNNGH